MKKILLPLALGLLCIAAQAQSSVENIIQSITPDVIGTAILNEEALGNYFKAIDNLATKDLAAITGNTTIITVITFTSKQAPAIYVMALNGTDTSVLATYKNDIAKIKGINTSSGTFSTAIISTINEGGDKEAGFNPPLEVPQDKRIALYKEMSLEAKITYLKKWVNNEIMPVLFYYYKNTDPKFEGVYNFGKTLQTKSYINGNIDNLTYNNPDYRRAVVEMSNGNQLIPFTKACMHIANGELDKGTRILSVINFFMEDATLPNAYRYELGTYLQLLNATHNQEMNKGIVKHDAGDFKGAIAIYNNILKVDPKSAYTNYELYFSTTGQDPDLIKSLWNTKYKDIVYGLDPLYGTCPSASNGKEGYQMYCRIQIDKLLQDKNTIKQDFIKYADIALDLEQYGFAAQMYWLILSSFKPEEYDNRNMLGYFLYCYHKLGDTEIEKNFKGDFANTYTKIEQERQEIMEANSFYQKLKHKN